MNPSHQSQRRTNVWREVTSPAREPMLQHDLPGVVGRDALATHSRLMEAVRTMARQARLRSTSLDAVNLHATKRNEKPLG